MKLGLLLMAAATASAAGLAMAQERPPSTPPHEGRFLARYTIVPIPQPRLKASAEIDDLSDSGAAIGSFDYSAKDGSLEGRGFLAQGNTVVRLPALPSGVNAASQVVLNDDVVVDPSGALGGRALVWKNGRCVPLSISSRDRGSIGLAINNSSHIAGAILSARHIWNASLWENDRPISLAKLGVNSQAIALNNRDQALVVVSDDQHTVGMDHYQRTPMLWSHGRLLPIVGLQTRCEVNTAGLTGVRADKYALNNLGQVMLQSTVWDNDSPADTRVQIWWNGLITSIHGLDDANGMNDRGQVVGDGSIQGSDINLAMLWENGRVQDLNALLPPHSGWFLHKAKAINNKGQIVGEGEYHGVDRNFLMTPTS